VRAEVKMNAIKTDDGEDLDINSLRKGLEYVFESITNCGQLQKISSSLYANSWFVLLSLMLAMVLSLTWTVLVTFAAKPVLWTSIVLYPVVLLAGTVVSLTRFRQLTGEKDDLFIPANITSIDSNWYSRMLWLVSGVFLCFLTLIIFFFNLYFSRSFKIAIKHIEKGKEKNRIKKTFILLPLIKSLSCILVICLSLAVLSLLASTGAPEFMVVDSCPSETCLNKETGKMYSLHDKGCTRQAFAECTGCPRARCVYHRVVQDRKVAWMHVVNLASMVGMVITLNQWASIVKIRGKCYLGPLAGWSALSCLTWQHTSTRCEGISVHVKAAEIYIIFTSQLFLLGLLAAATVATFYSQTFSFLDHPFQHGLIIITILGSYFTSGWVSLCSALEKAVSIRLEKCAVERDIHDENLNCI